MHPLPSTFMGSSGGGGPPCQRSVSRRQCRRRSSKRHSALDRAKYPFPLSSLWLYRTFQKSARSTGSVSGATCLPRSSLMTGHKPSSRCVDQRQRSLHRKHQCSVANANWNLLCGAASRTSRSHTSFGCSHTTSPTSLAKYRTGGHGYAGCALTCVACRVTSSR